MKIGKSRKVAHKIYRKSAEDVKQGVPRAFGTSSKIQQSWTSGTFGTLPEF